MKHMIAPVILGAALILTGCSAATNGEAGAPLMAAPGAPGAPAKWSNAEKVAIGTSYEAYDGAGAYSEQSPTAPLSKVWFSLTEDRITEVMWGLIHEAQIREIQLHLVGPDGIVAPDRVELILDGGVRPTSPATGLVLIYAGIDQAIQMTSFTDPDRDSLVVKIDLLEPLPDGYQLFAYIDPALANTGGGDRAQVTSNGLHAYDGDAHLFARLGGDAQSVISVGYVGASDGLSDLQDGALDQVFTEAREVGNIAGLVGLSFRSQELTPEAPELSTSLGLEAALIVGFGGSLDAAKANADATAARPALSVYSEYSDQWQSYLGTLEHLPELADAAEDGGALAYMSAINLKVMEDKTYAGALIASLSNPWGETAPAEQSQTGYKAVWPRDFFQVASAFLAMGDEETAHAAYRYLPTVQVTEDTPGNDGVTGWFLQKTHVDGTLEWVAIQQDQTAMPIMLGWKLWQAGVISDAEMAESYRTMLKPAADFLVQGGRPNLLWNTEFEASLGYTQQDRWEEQEGYSPSTVAAVISGLVVAADLAEQFGAPEDAETYLAAADQLEANVENWMFTTRGDLGDGAYFIRVSRNQDPNDNAMLGDNNGRPGLPESQIIDGGFLELVRYGVRAWNASSIEATLGEYLDQQREDNLRTAYAFGASEGGALGFRRYGNDGYGEDGEGGTNYHQIDGGNTPGQRGRVWPFFTGEYAHYELARSQAENGLQQASSFSSAALQRMEAFANAGLSLPEQVWDGVGPNPFGYEFGEGTNTATPLAWTHAEYIKLLRSVSDGQVWDHYSIVAGRYQDSPRNQPAE